MSNVSARCRLVALVTFVALGISEGRAQNPDSGEKKAHVTTIQRWPVQSVSRGKTPVGPPSVSPQRLPPVSTEYLRALDEALKENLKELKISPLIPQATLDGLLSDDTVEPPLKELADALQALLKQRRAKPVIAPEPGTTAGLTQLLAFLGRKGATGTHDGGSKAAGKEAGKAVPTKNTPEAPGETLRPTPVEAPVPRPTVVSALPGAPAAEGVTFRLSRFLVSRDGSSNEELPIPAGDRPVAGFDLSHRGGVPPVLLELRVSLPYLISLGQSTQLQAQATARGVESAAELVLLGEVVDGPRAVSSAVRLEASGDVLFSFVRRVGGIYAYQQTFNGALISRREPHSIQLNWTDRESSLEFPIAWSSVSPASRIAARAVYVPVRRNQVK